MASPFKSPESAAPAPEKVRELARHGLVNMQNSFELSVQDLTSQLQDLKSQVELYKEQCSVLRAECQTLHALQPPPCRCRAILDFTLNLHARGMMRKFFFEWMRVSHSARRSEQDQLTMAFVCNKLYKTDLAMAFERFCSAVAHLKAQGRMAKRMAFWMRKRWFCRLLRQWSRTAIRQQLLDAEEQLNNIQSGQQFSVRRKEAPFMEGLISSLQIFGRQWQLLNVSPRSEDAISAHIARISCAKRVSGLMKRALLDSGFRQFLAGLVESRKESVKVRQFAARKDARVCLHAFRCLREETKSLRDYEQNLGHALAWIQAGILWQHLHAWHSVRAGTAADAKRDRAVQTFERQSGSPDPAKPLHPLDEGQKKVLAMLLAAGLRKRTQDSVNGENPAEELRSGHGHTLSQDSWRGEDRLDVSNISADSSDSRSSDHLRDLRTALQSATQCLDKRVAWTAARDGSNLSLPGQDVVEECEELSTSIVSALGKIDSLCQDLDLNVRSDGWRAMGARLP